MELDLRTMPENAQSLERDVVPGRWLVGARHRRRTWEIVIEPDATLRLLVVVTAYPVAARAGGPGRAVAAQRAFAVLTRRTVNVFRTTSS